MLDFYIKDIIYGGLDGIITTFVIIASVAGANLDNNIVITLGFVNLFADGFSMGASAYLGTKAKMELDHKCNTSPFKSFVATFCAFIIFGIIPLLPYLIFTQDVFFLSIVMTLIAMILLGYFRSFVTKCDVTRCICETVCIGEFSAAVAFCIGYVLGNIQK